MEEVDLNIDDIDREIIHLLVENPEITHEEIAARVNRSQPAVGARIQKLKKKNLISNQVGVNFRTANLVLGIVTFSGRHPVQLKPYLNTIPQFVHIFKTSGASNFMLLVPGLNMKEIDHIVNTYLRPHPDVSDITVNYLSESLRTLVLPYVLALEHAPPRVEGIEIKPMLEMPLQTPLITRKVNKKGIA
ncbi:MAG: AsnC family transcriptional regulator [Promethearchaeota archaeon CR_4]|nr:MAG: AsnC family transcriptional regulator [Candidatus Lokiarchaeota archaeon CR_4]